MDIIVEVDECVCDVAGNFRLWQTAKRTRTRWLQQANKQRSICMTTNEESLYYQSRWWYCWHIPLFTVGWFTPQFWSRILHRTDSSGEFQFLRTYGYSTGKFIPIIIIIGLMSISACVQERRHIYSMLAWIWWFPIQNYVLLKQNFMPDALPDPDTSRFLAGGLYWPSLWRMRQIARHLKPAIAN